MAVCPSLMLRVLFLCGLATVHGGTVTVSNMYANNLSGDPFGNPPDPYVKLYWDGVFGGQTEFIKDNKNPRWSATFYFPDKQLGDELRLEVWDKDLNFDDHLATCSTRLFTGTNDVNCGVGKKGTFFYTVEYSS